MSDHVPGPWAVRRNSTGTFSVVADDGREIAAITAYPWTEEAAEANANLIATAPALADAANRPHAPEIRRLRDYFAAHAPEQPWPHFMPVLPPKPSAPPYTPVGNDGEAPTQEQANALNDWRGDRCCWDPREEDAYRCFSNWCDAWDRYYGAIGEWERNQWIERAEQWPWFYADAMLKRRGA